MTTGDVLARITRPAVDGPAVQPRHGFDEPTSAMGFTPLLPDPADAQAEYVGRHRPAPDAHVARPRSERTHRGGVRGFAAVLPWNWRRRTAR